MTLRTVAEYNRRGSAVCVRDGDGIERWSYNGSLYECGPEIEVYGYNTEGIRLAPIEQVLKFGKLKAKEDDHA